MKKGKFNKLWMLPIIFTMLILTGFVSVANAGEWDTSLLGQITTYDSVGIGTNTPSQYSLFNAYTTASNNDLRTAATFSALQTGSYNSVGVAASARINNSGGGGAATGISGLAMAYQTGDLTTAVHPNAGLRGISSEVAYNFSSNKDATIANAVGMSTVHKIRGNWNGTETLTVTNMTGYSSTGFDSNFTPFEETEDIVNIDTMVHFRAYDSITNNSGATVNMTDQVGLYIEKMLAADNNYGIVLNGDGAGADIVFGDVQKTKLFGNAGDFIIDTPGNVGIGTPNPTEDLHVYTSSGDADILIQSRGATDAPRLILDTGTGSPNPKILFEENTVIKGRIDYDISESNLTINNSSTLDNQLVLSDSGNVGIGTTNPSHLLDIKGTQTVERIAIRNSTASQGLHIGVAANNESFISQKENQPMHFSTNDELAMTIDATGNVGIGTINPQVALEVIGNGNFTGSVTASNITAHYQDLAEWVMTTELLTPGTVVMIDTEKVDHVTPSDNEYTTLVAGVVSPAPGIILGVEGENKAMVAHTGRVKVKVDTSYGEIKVGDLLVTSPVKGYAMKADRSRLAPGMLLGKALQPLAAGQQGEVLTLVTLQ